MWSSLLVGYEFSHVVMFVSHPTLIGLNLDGWMDGLVAVCAAIAIAAAASACLCG